jgi:hypothetical protein
MNKFLLFVAMILMSIAVFFAVDNMALVLAAPDSGIVASNPPSDQINTSIITSVFSAFKGHKYREAIAGVITILMFVWRKFGSSFLVGKLSTNWLRVIVVMFGLLGTLPAALAATTFGWQDFIVNSLITSAEAIAFWHVVLEKLPFFNSIPSKS